MSNEELVAAIQGGEDRMVELWEQVADLVKWKANRVISALEGRGGVDFEDLYHSGYPAMVAAVGSYKPESGAFSTWFMYHLKTAFAEATGYRSARQQRDPIHSASSLDIPLTDEAGSGTLMDLVPDPCGLATLEAAEHRQYLRQLHEAMEAALAQLPDRYRDTLCQRYYEGRTLAELAQAQGLTTGRIHEIERKALRLLRSPATVCHLRPFYDFDFYCGTGLGAFRHTGMSIQERYLVIEEDRKERAERRRRQEEEERERQAREALESYDQHLAKMIQELSPEARERLEKLRSGENVSLIFSL